MDTKRLVISVSALALLVAGLAALLFLRGGRSETTASTSDTPYSFSATLKAVPSDAALVLCLDGSRQARRLSADSTGLLRTLIAPDGDTGILRYLSKVASLRTSVSLHNSGVLVPLVVSELAPADSSSAASCAAVAEEAGMRTRFIADAGLLLASRSETLVQAAARHWDEGYSVLDSDGFKEAALRGRKGCQVLFTSRYAPKLYQAYGAPAVRGRAGRAGHYAQWGVLGFDEVAPDRIALSGSASTSGVDYLDVFSAQGGGSFLFAEMLPSNVLSARAVRVSDISSYLEKYSRYSDVVSGVSKLDDAWVKSVAVKEVAAADFDLDGQTVRGLLVLPGRDVRLPKGTSKNRKRGLSSCFGPSFSAPYDSLCLQVGKWIVMGPEPLVRAYSDKRFLKVTLKQLLSDAGVDLPGRSGWVSYHAAGTGFLESTFSKPVSAAVLHYLDGAPFGALLVHAGSDSGKPAAGFVLARPAAAPEGEVLSLRDTVVVVPDGPFKVMNSATGKENELYQNKHLSICLRDENGKDQWGIPFKERFCGCVETIDYFRNGRSQFLFAAGSKLYLIDRVGRFVGGFPAELGRSVLLGPQVMDLGEEGGYRAFVLHTDNTIGLYDLQGRKPEGWKDLMSEHSLKGLPVAAEVSGKNYWIVPTSAGPAIYPEEGGAPIGGKEAAKLLKRAKTK